MNLDFTSRQTYLLWRLRWKAEYAAACTAVRQAKNQIKAVNRTLARDAKIIETVYSAYAEALESTYRADVNLHQAKQEVIRLLDALAKARIEAHRQWLASRT